MRFSQRLKLLRKELDLSQDKLAKACNVKLTAISKYENELIKPSFEMLSKIGTAFNVNLNWLINDVGSMFLSNKEVTLAKTGSDNREINVNCDVQSVTIHEDTHDLELANDIQVKYFYPESDEFVKIFHKNGQIDRISQNDNQEVLHLLLKKLSMECTDKNRLDFIMTAIDALNDENAFIELKALIKGMEISKKI